MESAMRSFSLYGLLFLTGLGVAGCATLDTLHMDVPWRDAPASGTVAQVMALWADGIVIQPDPVRNGAPTPGFQGRVYLFGSELDTTMRAEGSFVVYLYDDLKQTGPAVPSEVWDLDAANLERVLKKDGLGWGYNIWLPWSKYQPGIKHVKLVVCYKPTKGPSVWSGSSPLTVGSGEKAMKPPSLLQTTSYNTK
jgi:hypothetical protein